jgi:hypothetical protein
LAVGVKTTVNATLAPGWMFTGSGKFTTEKAPPGFVMEEMRRVLRPGFDSWKE